MSGLLEIISKSDKKEEIGFYVNALHNALTGEKRIMNVQLYYYLYTIYKPQILPITNRLFSLVKEPTLNPQGGVSHSEKSAQ